MYYNALLIMMDRILCHSFSFSLLATCSADTTTRLWWTGPNGVAGHKSPEPYSLLRTLKGHTKWVWDCAFTVDSKYLVTCSSDQTAKLWEVSNGEVVKNYIGHHKPISCVGLNDFAS